MHTVVVSYLAFSNKHTQALVKDAPPTQTHTHAATPQDLEGTQVALERRRQQLELEAQELELGTGRDREGVVVGGWGCGWWVWVGCISYIDTAECVRNRLRPLPPRRPPLGLE